MSLKPIDVQLALSRTSETGKLQNQLTHKPVEDQMNLAVTASKKTEEMRKKSTGVDGVREMLIQEDGRQNQGKPNPQRRKPKDGEPAPDPDRPEHPYKGHHVDFSL